MHDGFPAGDMPRPHPTYGPIFGVAHGLPRGPHRLTREQVAESQRVRLLIAMTEAVAQRGYGAVSVAQVAQSAGVSPATFYAHFSDKLACFLAGHETFTAVVLERIEAALTDDADLDGLVAATLTAYLGSLQADPSAARAFLIEGATAGPAVRRLRRVANDRLAARLRESHQRLCARDPQLRELPRMAYPAIAHAVRELTCDLLEASQHPEPLALVDDLTACLTTTLWLSRASPGG